MPIYQCSNKKWKIGKNGKCRFETKEKAENAFKHWIEEEELNENPRRKTRYKELRKYAAKLAREKMREDDFEPTFNPEDVVSLDVPLLIRLLEYAREDAKTDVDLHNLADRLIALSSMGKTLNMDDYDQLVPQEEQSEENYPEADRYAELAGIRKEY